MNKQDLLIIVKDVIDTYGPTTKKQIKNYTYDFAEKNGILTKEFVIAFGDIGWVFQNLKPSVQVNKINGKWLWESV